MEIVSRSRWGATAALGPAMRLPAREVWLHHSVTQATGDAAADMRAIERIGVQRFGRYSYSYAVHSNGTVLEGAGLTVGAHTANRNSTSFGIVWIGNYENDQPSGAQINNTAELIRHLVATGRLQGGAPLGGHRDVSATACPGRNAYPRLPEIRRLAGNLPGPGGSVPGAGGPLLRRGSRGEEVRIWQTILHGASLLPASGVDGVFGPATEAATRRFQTALGVAADGIVGPDTREATGRLLAWLAGQSPPVVPPFPGTVRRGSTGAAVSTVQARLRDRGWSITVDGVFGPRTEEVVRAFQREKGLAVDGIVGPATWNALWTAPIT
jgi:peptidoglycan hydrolase-like protein with peptidoglycan-binding domain